MRHPGGARLLDLAAAARRGRPRGRRGHDQAEAHQGHAEGHGALRCVARGPGGHQRGEDAGRTRPRTPAVSYVRPDRYRRSSPSPGPLQEGPASNKPEGTNN